MLYLVHYSEIALKGDNKRFFEDILISNIKKQLGSGNFSKINRLWGRILVESKNDDMVRNTLNHVFGIANFSETLECGVNMEEIKDRAWSLMEKKEFTTFKVASKRAQKTIPFTSMDINREVGAYIVEKTGAGVQLKGSDVTVYVEVMNDRAFVYTEKISGPGGLPVGSAGKAISLLSSGIDSPVSTWKMMKRGVVPVFVHFHSYPQTSMASLENAKELANILGTWSPDPLTLYAVPFLDIQKLFVANTPRPLSVIMYRRSMMRIAEIIAKKEKSLALITGDSVGQVASQTIPNIFVINEAASLPVLRPNVGDNKEEIINLAKQISTYEVSIRPYEDCCSLFVPDHPATNARLEDVIKAEEKIKKELGKLEEEAVKNTKKAPAN